jgi:thiamine-phosphate pyrophosphorylase
LPVSDIDALKRAVRKLEPARRGARALPTLLAFTDPQRSGDLEALARRLPCGAALVYRSFGAADALATARRLRRITWRRGVMLVIGGDAALARRVHADGVHLPERMMGRIRPRHPGLLTIAAHGPAAARRALALGADAVVLSAILQSESPSAGKPLGVLKLARIAGSLEGALYALGGIKGSNAARVAATGVAGLAAVGAFAV